MSATPAASPGTRAAPPPARFRVAIEYAIDGDLRFLGHHDELRMLARALVRAGWPLRYTGGFNPRPRLSVLLPRGIGIAADEQLALVDLAEPRRPAALFTSLSAAMPQQVPLRRITAPAPEATPHPRAVLYTVELLDADAARIDAALAALLSRTEFILNRDFGPGRPARPVDIRPHVAALARNGATLHLRLSFDRQRTARPLEIITELGLPPEEYGHRIRRRQVEWDICIAGPACGPAELERNSLVRSEEASRSQAAQARHQGTQISIAPRADRGDRIRTPA